MRRSFVAGLTAFLGIGSAKAQTRPASFPPVPVWRPSFGQPLDAIIDRISYYSDGMRDFTVFRNGTCVILDPGLTDEVAAATSLRILSDILRGHPDMNPSPMDDGNVLVRYNHPAVNVVLQEVAEAHWPEIEARHLDGLAGPEVLITPLGPNKFDHLGMLALLGRAYMFMDATAPEIVELKRHPR